MKGNNKKIREPFIWLIFIISTLIFRIIGFGSIPTVPLVIYSIILGVLVCGSLYKHKNEILGAKYYLSLAFSFALAVISLLFSMLTARYYPKIFEKYNTLLGIVTVGSFFLMMGVIIFGGYLKSKQNKK